MEINEIKGRLLWYANVFEDMIKNEMSKGEVPILSLSDIDDFKRTIAELSKNQREE